MTTPTRSEVLNANEAIRRGNARKPTRLPDGEVAFRIPQEDWELLMVQFPELSHADAPRRLDAWKRFRHSDEGRKYLVVRAPATVQRSNNHRIIVK